MAIATIIAPNARSLAANRFHLIEDWGRTGYEVVVLLPEAEMSRIPPMLGHLRILPIPLRRTGMNPVVDVRSVAVIASILRKISPEFVFSYSIKPVIYGSLAADLAGVRRIYSMITGLGHMFVDSSLRTRLLRPGIRLLYRLALRRNSAVFFQNPDDLSQFRSVGLIAPTIPTVLINGSGVDLEQFPRVPFSDTSTSAVSFVLIARLLRDKGIVEFVEAARLVRERCRHASFSVVGPHEPDLPHALSTCILDQWRSEGLVSFVGGVSDVRPYLAAATVGVLPSYREGTPKSVLEFMATGRPIITTDAPGCRETVIEGLNGFLVPAKNVTVLADRMLTLANDATLIRRMGEESRRLAERKYDVRAVIKTINAAIMPTSVATCGSPTT